MSNTQTRTIKRNADAQNGAGGLIASKGNAGAFAARVHPARTTKVGDSQLTRDIQALGLGLTVVPGPGDTAEMQMATVIRPSGQVTDIQRTKSSITMQTRWEDSPVTTPRIVRHAEAAEAIKTQIVAAAAYRVAAEFGLDNQINARLTGVRFYEDRYRERFIELTTVAEEDIDDEARPVAVVTRANVRTGVITHLNETLSNTFEEDELQTELVFAGAEGGDTDGGRTRLITAMQHAWDTDPDRQV